MIQVRKLALGLFAVMVILIIGAPVALLLTRQRCTHTSEENGKAVIVALESYREVHGVFPDKLSQLAPGFLASVPPPACGGDWEYESTSNQLDFFLAFIPSELREGRVYDTKRKVWEPYLE
jgi:hypothetical protein